MSRGYILRDFQSYWWWNWAVIMREWRRLRILLISSIRYISLEILILVWLIRSKSLIGCIRVWGHITLNLWIYLLGLILLWILICTLNIISITSRLSNLFTLDFVDYISYLLIEVQIIFFITSVVFNYFLPFSICKYLYLFIICVICFCLILIIIFNLLFYHYKYTYQYYK